MHSRLARLARIASRLLGTVEPMPAAPDEELLAAARAMRARVAPARLRELVVSLPGPRSRLHAPAAMAATDDLILDAWRGHGWTTERQGLHLRNVRGVYDHPVAGQGRYPRLIYPRLDGANLVALKPGTTPDAVVVVAHHDTVRDAPGADDNGAGVVVLIELARLLAAHEMRLTVILAAPDFEEIGLIGSRELVRVLNGQHRVAAAIVFDPIGYMDPRPGSQVVPPGIEALYPGQVARIRARRFAGDGVVTLYQRRSRRLAEAYAGCLAALIGPDRVISLRDPTDIRLIGRFLLVVPVVRNFARSDHRRFWDARLPAIQVTNTANFRNPNYHRATDTPDTLDYTTLADVTAATALAVERLAA